MPLPDYQMVVISCVTGQVVGIFDGASFFELRYSRKLNDVGTVAFSIDGTQENVNIFAYDNFIEIKRTHPVTGLLVNEETYLVRSQQILVDESDRDILVVGGMSLNSLLMRRLIDPADDPAASGGYSTKTGPADTVMRAYVREQAADLASAARQFAGFTVVPVAGSGVTVSESCRYNILFNKIQDLAIRSQIDFQIRRTTGAAMELTIARQGNDRTKTTNYPFGQWVGLTPFRGNLSHPSLKIDRSNENNFVYCLGQGQGAARQLVQVAGDTSYSPFARCEYVKDSRNVDKANSAGLTTAAYQSIAAEKIKQEFTFSPTNYEAGAIYKKDYDLADSLTVIWKGFEIDLRVSRVELTLNKDAEDIAIGVNQTYA